MDSIKSRINPLNPEISPDLLQGSRHGELDIRTVKEAIHQGPSHRTTSETVGHQRYGRRGWEDVFWTRVGGRFKTSGFFTLW